MHSPLFHLEFIRIGGDNSPHLSLSLSLQKIHFHIFFSAVRPFIPEFPRHFGDRPSVGAVSGGGINHMDGSRSAM